MDCEWGEIFSPGTFRRSRLPPVAVDSSRKYLTFSAVPFPKKTWFHAHLCRRPSRPNCCTWTGKNWSNSTALVLRPASVGVAVSRGAGDRSEQLPRIARSVRLLMGLGLTIYQSILVGHSPLAEATVGCNGALTCYDKWKAILLLLPRIATRVPIELIDRNSNV